AAHAHDHAHADPAGHSDPHDHWDEHAHDGHHDSPQDGHHEPQHTAHDAHDGHVGHHIHHDHGARVAPYRRLFWIMLAIGIPVVALSPTFAHILGYSIPDVPLLEWVAPVLGTIMYVWGGRPFLTGAIDEFKARQPGMMMLIAL